MLSCLHFWLRLLVYQWTNQRFMAMTTGSVSIQTIHLNILSGLHDKSSLLGWILHEIMHKFTEFWGGTLLKYQNECYMALAICVCAWYNICRCKKLHFLCEPTFHMLRAGCELWSSSWQCPSLMTCNSSISRGIVLIISWGSRYFPECQGKLCLKR